MTRPKYRRAERVFITGDVALADIHFVFDKWLSRWAPHPESKILLPDGDYIFAPSWAPDTAVLVQRRASGLDVIGLTHDGWRPFTPPATFEPDLALAEMTDIRALVARAEYLTQRQVSSKTTLTERAGANTALRKALAGLDALSDRAMSSSLTCGDFWTPPPPPEDMVTFGFWHRLENAA